VRRGPDVGLAAVLVAVAVFAFILLSSGSFSGMPGGPPVIICIPFLFVILFAVLGLYKATSGRRTIPPPPPIQQRMVPAGQQGPVSLDCPNCGGPPSNVDRFGIAVCSYCGTRFLVR
jgi:uncharacterized RDD family membrane protein YckC